jgi:formylglycine-generating enzyme required for sulfatase activity
MRKDFISFKQVKVEGDGPVKSFVMTETVITQRHFEAIMGFNPSWFNINYYKSWNPNSHWNEDYRDDAPVESINSYHIEEFINRIRQQSNDMSWRLPTVEEWEFAARGGNKSQGYQYAGGNNLEDVAWYNKPKRTPVPGPYLVGKKFPNELGLYDMLGNVWEVTCSTLVKDGYTFTALKGGSYESSELSIDKTCWVFSSRYDDNTSFRLVRDVRPTDL